MLDFFQEALDEIGIPHREHFIETAELDISQPPDDIVYMNCVGSDAQSRGHDASIIRLEQYLEHLAAYNRKVINDYRTLDFLTSHVGQIRLFKRFGLAFPQTVFSSDRDELLKMAANLQFPVIVRYDRTGQSASAQRCEDWHALESYLRIDSAASRAEHVTILQQYIAPKDGITSRAEFIDYKPVYIANFRCDPALPLAAVEYASVDTSSDKTQLIDRYAEMCRSSGLRMAGVQYVIADNGSVYTLGVHGVSEYVRQAEDQTDQRARRAFQTMIKTMVQ